MRIQYAFSIIIIFLCLAMTNGFCMKSPPPPTNFPKELLYQDQPIDPLCFYEFENANAVVSLKSCGLDAEQGRKIVSRDKALTAKNYIGFDFIWPIDEKSQPSRGYSYYKVLGHINDTYYIKTLNNGGSSGQFTSVLQVTRDNNKLTIRTVASGDRCNGGITHARLEDQLLTYSINLTTFDFLSLAHQNPHQLTAYNDLDACAACCQATATMVKDLGKDTNLEKLISVDLGSENIESSDISSYQTCFDKLLTDYRKSDKRILTPQDFTTLVNTFNSTCAN